MPETFSTETSGMPPARLLRCRVLDHHVRVGPAEAPNDDAAAAWTKHAGHGGARWRTAASPTASTKPDHRVVRLECAYTASTALMVATRRPPQVADLDLDH